MKPRARSEWMAPAASTAVAAVRDRPGARLVGPGGEEADQAEQLVAQADDPLEARAPPGPGPRGRRRPPPRPARRSPSRSRADSASTIVWRCLIRERASATSSAARAMSASPTLSSTSTGFSVRKRKPRMRFGVVLGQLQVADRAALGQRGQHALQHLQLALVRLALLRACRGGRWCAASRRASRPRRDPPA